MKNNVEKDGITVADAYRLKHEINKSITYKGMNAREVEETKKMTKEDWEEVKTSYKAWAKDMQSIPDWGLVVLCIGSSLALGLFEGWVRAILVLVAIYTGYNATKRVARWEGYVDGFSDGVDKGINKALGLSSDEAADIFNRSIEMEIDESIVDHLNKES